MTYRLLLAVAFLLASCSPAHAGTLRDAVDLEINKRRADLRVTFTYDSEACDGECSVRLRVFKGSRRLFSRSDDVFADDPDLPFYDENGEQVSFEYGDVSYDFSCRRTGRLRYEVLIQSDAAGVPDEMVRHPFTVPRCGRFVPFRIQRGTAARYVASNYEDEFVSSARCVPLAPMLKSRSHRWQCDVTHNNTYRECTTRYTSTYLRRREFGRYSYSGPERTKTLGCRFF